MKAKQLFYFKDRQGDLIVEMVLWQLPQPAQGSIHGFKYRLFCGERGVCHVRYDNEAGKGDHVHWGQTEQAYHFTNPKQLIDDFWVDVARLTSWRFL